MPSYSSLTRSYCPGRRYVGPAAAATFASKQTLPPLPSCCSIYPGAATLASISTSNRRPPAYFCCRFACVSSTCSLLFLLPFLLFRLHSDCSYCRCCLYLLSDIPLLRVCCRSYTCVAIRVRSFTAVLLPRICFCCYTRVSLTSCHHSGRPTPATPSAVTSTRSTCPPCRTCHYRLRSLFVVSKLGMHCRYLPLRMAC